MRPLLARPRVSISIMRALKVPSLRVNSFCFMNSLASFHFPLSMCRSSRQSMAWSFSRTVFIAASLGFFRIRFVFSSNSVLFFIYFLFLICLLLLCSIVFSL